MKINSNKKPYLFIVLLWIVFSYSCSPEKHLQKGQALYTGASIAFEPDTGTAPKLEDELEGLLRPKPNASFLGMYPKLFFYNISKKPKGKGLNYLLHEKWGEPPVLASSLNLTANENILQNHLQNNGFFQAMVTGDSTQRHRKVEAKYLVDAGRRYLISRVFFPEDSTILINREIDSTKGKTLLKPGDFYDLDVIKAERVRIKDTLKNKGYFYFTPDNLIVKVDSTLNGKVDMYLRVKEDAPPAALEKYYINDINVFANYSLGKDSLLRSMKGASYEGLNVIDPKHLFRPSIFSRAIYLTPGKLYTLADHELTLSRLVNLGAFKYVRVEFNPVDSGSGKGYLNTNVYLTPAKKKSLRLEITGNSRSNNYVGASANLSWRNRNIFKGAELFKLQLGGAFETQVGGDQDGSNTYSFSPGVSVEVPRFVTPFQVINLSRVKVPKTVLNINYELLHRQDYYNLNSFNLQAGYNWRQTSRITNTLHVFDVSYVLPSHLTPLFEDILKDDPTLQRSFRKQFILGTNYRFEYSDRLETKKSNNVYFIGQADVSGNLLGLFMGKHDHEHPATLFGSPFSQFLKVSADLRDYWHLNDRGLDWANRLFMGYGFSYGNSYSLPFVKQFFIGGSNSLRGFRARTLGPGNYHTERTGFQANEAGDIKLEINTELRFPIVSIVKGAVFADAGNIWLLRGDSTRPGAKFKMEEAFNQLAVDAGLGLRFDLSFFVLRFDLAFPLRKPWLPKGERWVIEQIDFGDKAWRKENIVLNIAIGYPF